MNWVATLASAFAPWQSLYADSRLVSTLVTGTHVIALLAGGGLAIAADRMTLRSLRRPVGERVFHMQELGWVKLGLVALLLINGAVLYSTEARLAAEPGAAAEDGLWRRLGTTARLSLGLWVTTAVVGTVLTAI
jgi:hypothetical protein